MLFYRAFIKELSSWDYYIFENISAMATNICQTMVPTKLYLPNNGPHKTIFVSGETQIIKNSTK